MYEIFHIVRIGHVARMRTEQARAKLWREFSVGDPHIEEWKGG